MFSSNEIKDISQLNPILLKDNYPSAPTIKSSDIETISVPTLQYDIKIKEEEEQVVLLLSNNKIMYYYHDLSLPQQQKEAGQPVQKEEENLLLFQNYHKKPIWKLTNRDWHGITLTFKDITVILSTTPPNFRFAFNKQFYHWQVVKGEESTISYKIKCYETETKELIAQLDHNKLLLDILPTIVVKEEDSNTISNTNPFRKSSNVNENEDDPFTTFIILSGLLVNNHIKSLLKSLGGNQEALQMIIDPPSTTATTTNIYNSTMYHKQQQEGEEEDDIASLSSTYPRHYSGHQSLVDDRYGNRWSSAQSFKSIELDPGVWHCWWGYKFWWSWFPCCMPGGCCDRACIRLKGHKPKTRSSNTRTLSKQGWKQQHY